MKKTRRDFITVAGTAVAAVAGAGSLEAGSLIAQAAQPGAAASAGNTADPDLIVLNAKVYTMDTRAPRAEAFAVKGGRFTAVGSTSDVRNLAGKNTQTFDAKGMTVVPGFIDCH